MYELSETATSPGLEVVPFCGRVSCVDCLCVAALASWLGLDWTELRVVPGKCFMQGILGGRTSAGVVQPEVVPGEHCNEGSFGAMAEAGEVSEES